MIHAPTWPTLGASSAHLVGSRLLAVASAQPDRIVTAADLGRPFDRTADWVRDRTGIDQVHRLDHGGDVVALAVDAARTALDRAGLAAAEVDLVLTASCSITAPTADDLAHAIAPRAGRMYLNAACSGFCYALSTADNLIRTGAATTVLVVAAEQMSALLDPADLATSIIFGDGAGAAVLTATDRSNAAIGPLVCGSDGTRAALIACRNDGLLEMMGREVFRWAVETVPTLALEICHRAGLRLADLAAFIPHQANRRIIDAVANRLGVPTMHVSTDISRSGNASAASIPIALDRLLSDHPELGGRHALLIGFGAGLAYAGQVIRLP